MAAKWADRFQIRPGRWVFVPSDESALAGRQIKHELESRWSVPWYYYHLQPGGHVSALRAHLDSEAFWHADIENFFGTINRSRITRSLKSIIGYETARRWATESTVVIPGQKGWVLPYGFIQSQLLASLCLRKSALGVRLLELQVTGSGMVSVYVDDIVVSAAAHALGPIVDSIRSAAERSRFTLNAKKEQPPGPEIQAFNIALRTGAIQISASRLETFRQALLDPECSEHRRRAIVAYIHSVAPSQASEFGLS